MPKKLKGVLFGLSLPWPDLALGGFRNVSKKWTDQCEDLVWKNKPRKAKVGAISKAQNCKRGDPSGFVKLSWLQNMKKKLKGALWGLGKISQKKLKMRFLNRVTVPKNVKGGNFLCCKISKQMKGTGFFGTVTLFKNLIFNVFLGNFPKSPKGSLQFFFIFCNQLEFHKVCTL